MMHNYNVVVTFDIAKIIEQENKYSSKKIRILILILLDYVMDMDKDKKNKVTSLMDID